MKTKVEHFSDDINDEFLKIKQNLRIHLEDTNNVKIKKMFLSRHVPREIILSSELLLDTVINALMDEARSQLKGVSAELLNKFYEHNFRERVKEWAVQIENKLYLKPEYVMYSSDPQMVQGLIAAGITFIAGAAITGIVFIPTMVIGAIVSGIVTLFLSAAAFKFAYDKAEPKAISKMIDDIDNYLESSKLQVSDWLSKVILSYENEFNSFCSNNGWEVQ